MAGNITQLTVRILLDTQNKSVLHCYLKGDSSGDLVKTKVYDVTAATYGYPSQLVLRNIGALVGFSAHLAFDQTTESVVEVLPNGYPFHYETEECDRLPIVNPLGAGTTGNITISTTGLNATQEGWFLLTITKKIPSPSVPNV